MFSYVLLQLLIKFGANVNQAQHPSLSTQYITTLLTSCLAYRQFTCFSLLIKAGADPDYLARDLTRNKTIAWQSLYFHAIHHNCDVSKGFYSFIFISFIHLLIHLFICLFVYFYIYSFIIHLFMPSSNKNLFVTQLFINSFHQNM